MLSPDSELLVETVPTSHTAPATLDDIVGVLNEASFGGVKVLTDSKKNPPEHEGNVNCAMDIFAPDQSSVSSVNSRFSSSGTLGPPNLSSSSEPKDTSDSDRVGQFKVKLGNNYMTLLNEHDQQDAASVASDSSFGEAINPYGRGFYSPKTSPSTPTRPPAPPRLLRTSSPHFPSSSITFPSKSPTKQWTVFGEDKENRLPSAEQGKILPVRAPPAIPDRKSIRVNRPAAQPNPVVSSSVGSVKLSADLLTMGTDDLEFHLSDVSFPGPSSKPAVPPRRNLFSTSSATSGSGSHAEDSDHELLPLPSPQCHINHARLSSGSSSPADLFQGTQAHINLTGPPIPPRRDFSLPKKDTPLSQEGPVFSPAATSSSISDFAIFPSPSAKTNAPFSLDTTPSTPSWVNFDDMSPAVTESVFSVPLQPSSGFNLTEDAQSQKSECGAVDLLATDAQDSVMSGSAVPKPGEAAHWKEPFSSPDIRPSSSKKKGGGIGYLCLENDDCENVGSTENLGSQNTIQQVAAPLPENDLSPEKPQSHWATFQNEEDEEESNNLDTVVDEVSCANSSPSFDINSSGLADSLNDVDGDLEDDFGLGINRLSADMPDLKGFNRADKGSQNNLVDFSDDRGSAAASTSSRDNIDDDDAETIFDLTAQGDSLKRRRPKHAVEIETTEKLALDLGKSDTEDTKDSVSYHVGPAGLDDIAVLAEEASPFGPVIQPATLAQGTSRTSTPQSSLSSRTGTPADSKLDSADSFISSKPAVSTNPFWSPTSTSGPDSTSQGSSVDSPFDKVVFKAAKTTQHGVVSPTSKSSTPLHVSLTTSPIVAGQLFRIPPPPLSQSRSSTRKRLSTAKERLRNTHHGASSAKKLDLDSASDASIKQESLASSRAETPVFAPNRSGSQTPNCHALKPDTLTNLDDVFDPFSNQSITDLDASFGKDPEKSNNDIFSWVDVPNEDQDGNSCNLVAVPETKQGPPGEDLQDITLVLDLDQAENTCNTNTNAQVFKAVEQTSDSNNIELLEKAIERPLVSETPDLLLELKKATSVESPNGIQSSEKAALPEVEIVDSKNLWDVFMRFPREKRTMSNRKWVPIHVKLNCDQVNNPLVKLYYTSKVKDPFHTVSLASHQMQLTKPKLQAHYSDEGQVLGKLHAVKLMVVYYKEKQTFSPRRSIIRNASGFRHACRGKQSIKFGFATHHDVISFYKAARDAMFNVHKRLPKSKEEEHSPSVKYHSRDELLIDVYDELQAVVKETGVMEACKVRVHLFVSSFISGDPMAKITLNDKKVEGREVVRREDIIPTSMEGWIDVRDPELHECCSLGSYRDGSDDSAGTCIFYPPDACKFELMRFATSYAEEELPVAIKPSIVVKGARLQMRCVIRMSGKHSANKDPLTQIACEDVMIRFPVPDEWGGFFRVDGRFRNHSVRAKRAAKQRRRPSSEAGVTMEASVGVAKYERAYRAIVWRLSRLPEKNADQNVPRVFSCRIELSSDRDLERLRASEESEESRGDGYKGGLDGRYRWCEVEYTMPGSTASNVCVRSLSLPNTDRAEKFVSYQSHYLYKVAINLSAEPVGADGEDDVGTTLCATQ